MKKVIVIIGIFILSWTLISCNHSIKNIKAEYFTISYGDSMYDPINQIDNETVDLLVNRYNKIELTGKTTKEINYSKAITITFIYKDQISGQVTFDDRGILSLHDKVENYTISEDSDFYETALEVYHNVKEKYKE